MAIRIGKVCIEGVNTEDDLKKHGIYYMGEDLDEVITKKKSLDFEFLVIDGDKDCLFIKAVKCLFNNQWPEDSGELKKIVKDEIPRDRFNEIECAETVFTWMSRVIERLPGRIIIVGDKNKPKKWNSNNDYICKWIKKRTAWITGLEKVKIELKEKESDSYEDLIKIENIQKLKPTELFLSLYNSWIKNFSKGKSFELLLNFKGEESKKITIDFIKKAAYEIKYKFLVEEMQNKNLRKVEEIEKIDDLDIFFPFYCPDDSLPDRDDNFPEKALNFKKEIKSDIYKNELKRAEISIDDYLNLFNCSLSGDSESDNGKKSKKLLNKILHSTDMDTPCRVPIILKNLSQDSSGKQFFLKQKNNSTKVKLKYSRHGKLEFHKLMDDLEDSRDSKEYFYQESLTGAASHFSLLYSAFCGNDEIQKAGMYFNLVENGLMRILVADERISDYVSCDKIKKMIFNCAGIFVIEKVDEILKNIDEKRVDDIFDYCYIERIDGVKNKVKAGAFDILIIHQGIIDKMKLKNEEIESKINNWKKKFFPYVVVTSGRGTPADVPLNVKFFPFSILESNLITSAISKLIVNRLVFKSLARRE